MVAFVSAPTLHILCLIITKENRDRTRCLIYLPFHGLCLLFTSFPFCMFLLLLFHLHG